MLGVNPGRIENRNCSMAGVNEHRYFSATENNSLCAAGLEALDDLVECFAGLVEDLSQAQLIVNDAMNLDSLRFIRDKNIQSVP